MNLNDLIKEFEKLRDDTNGQIFDLNKEITDLEGRIDDLESELEKEQNEREELTEKLSGIFVDM